MEVYGLQLIYGVILIFSADRSLNKYNWNNNICSKPDFVHTNYF